MWLLILASLIPGQVDTSKAVLECNSGTVLRGTCLTSTISLKTEFGTQEIPTNKIRSIEFGFHYAAGEEDTVKQAIGHLGSQAFAQRQKADALLRNFGKRALPLMPTKHGDAEVALRLAEIRSKILELEPGPHNYEDIIRTEKCLLVGRILQTQLDFFDSSLEHQKVNVAKLRTLKMTPPDLNISVDAKNDWAKSGCFMNKGQRVQVKASGTVELWPQQPGQFLATPKGYNSTTGKGGQFMAGSLIGKIGETGHAFWIGSESTIFANEDGELYLMIVGSPWNNLSEGSYQVKIEAK